MPPTSAAARIYFDDLIVPALLDSSSDCSFMSTTLVDQLQVVKIADPHQTLTIKQIVTSVSVPRVQAIAEFSFRPEDTQFRPRLHLN